MDGIEIEKSERIIAMEKFEILKLLLTRDIMIRYENRLTQETVMDILGSEHQQPTELSLESRSFKEIGLVLSTATQILPCPTLFASIVSLSLAENDLVSFSQLGFLPELRVLCLNRNRIAKLDERFLRHS